MEDFETMRGIAEEFGFGRGDRDLFSDPDPFAADEEELSPGDLEQRLKIALCEGLVQAGKIEEVRSFSSGFDAESQNLVEEFIQDRELISMSSADWRELKQVVEHGSLQENTNAERMVFEQWSKEDPQKAIDWFVGRVADPKNRCSRIAEVVRRWNHYAGSDGSYTDDGFFLQTNEFLKQRSLAGDQVGAGWIVLIGKVINWADWDRVLSMRDDVSPEAWQYALQRAEKLGSTDSIHIGDERLEFRTFSESQLNILDEFGLREKVQSEVELQNQEAFKKLGEVLDAE